MTKLQLEEIAGRKTAATAEAERVKLAANKAAADTAGNKVGMRSLLSNGWAGFSRGGDLTPQ